MAKKQTRRSISVSRTTYERLKSFCETNGISMSQVVETRVADFLGPDGQPMVAATPVAPRPNTSVSQPVRPVAAPPRSGAPMHAISKPTAPVSPAARYTVEPPLPIIKRTEQPTPKPPIVPKPDQIFTF